MKVLASVGVIIAFSLSPASAQDNSIIVFNSERGVSGRDIYSCNPDGSDLKKLTSFKSSGHYAHANGPQISPDGKQVVLHIDMDGHDRYTIWIMDIDGSNLTKLTTKEGLYPSWSPSGKEIAYSGRRQGVWEILTMDVATKKETNISKNRTNGKRPGWGAHTSWSPNNNQLAYSYVKEKIIYVMDLTNQGLRRITEEGTKSTYPVWSNDGHSIYMNYKGEGASSYSIVKVGLSTKNVMVVAENVISYSPFSLSPDELSLVFSGMVNGQQEVFVKDLTSGKESNITNHNAFDSFPNWGRVD